VLPRRAATIAKLGEQHLARCPFLVHETSERLDAFELRVLRFARETVRYQTRRLQELARGLPSVSRGMCCLRSSGWSRTRMASRA
jgi:hypothetical protein